MTYRKHQSGHETSVEYSEEGTRSPAHPQQSNIIASPREDEEAQGIMEEIQTSVNLNLPKNCDLSHNDKENERFHFERVYQIPNTPYVSFTSEEKLYVKYLVQIDKESKISLLDSLKSFGRSAVNNVRVQRIIKTIKFITKREFYFSSYRL